MLLKRKFKVVVRNILMLGCILALETYDWMANY